MNNKFYIIAKNPHLPIYIGTKTEYTNGACGGAPIASNRYVETYDVLDAVRVESQEEALVIIEEIVRQNRWSVHQINWEKFYIGEVIIKPEFTNNIKVVEVNGIK